MSDNTTEVDRMALATLADEARAALQHLDGGHASDVRDAIDAAEDALDD